MTVTFFIRIKTHQHFQSYLGFALAPGDRDKNQHHLITWSYLARDYMILPSQEGMLPLWSKLVLANLFTPPTPLHLVSRREAAMLVPFAGLGTRQTGTELSGTLDVSGHK